MANQMVYLAHHLVTRTVGTSRDWTSSGMADIQGRQYSLTKEEALKGMSKGRSFDRRLACIGIIVLIALVLAACSPASTPTPAPTKAPAASQPAASTPPAAKSPAAGSPSASDAGLTAKLYEAAKKEGEVMVYGAGTQQEFDEIGAAFTKKYPGIRFTAFVGTSEQIRDKVLTEARAGKPLASVVARGAFEDVDAYN